MEALFAFYNKIFSPNVSSHDLPYLYKDWVENALLFLNRQRNLSLIISIQIDGHTTKQESKSNHSSNIIRIFFPSFIRYIHESLVNW